MRMITMGPFEGNAWLLQRRMERALSAWGDRPRLAIVYMPVRARYEEILAAVEDVVRAPVVGATTGGAAFTERGFSRTGVVCGVLSGADLEIECAVARDLRADVVRGVRAALSEIEQSAGGSPRSGMQTSLLVLADGLACDGEALVAALRQGVTAHTRIFGGTAGDDWTFEGTRVFMGRRAISDAAVVVRLTHRQRVNMHVLHGFRFVEGGRDLTITDADKNVVKTLSGKPAASVYEDELRRLGLLAGYDTPLQAMATHELGARTPFGEELKIRAPLSVGHDGSITLASSLPKGQVVRVVTTDADSLIAAARRLSSAVLGPLSSVSGALVFDCAARLRLLGDRYGEEVRAFQAPVEHPMLGFAAYGEIAKFGGSVEGFHNTTAVMVGW